MSESSSSNKEINDQEENQRLIDLCTLKLEKDPANQKALLLRANLYIKMSLFSLARKDLTDLQSNPVLSSTIYYLLGFISKEEGDYEDSIQQLTKAIEADDNNVNAIFLRAAVNNTIGKFNEAIDDYYLALERDSKKSTRKNIFRNIEKILGIRNPSEDDLENPNVNQFTTKGSDTIDNEISKGLHDVFRKNNQLVPRKNIFSETDLGNSTRRGTEILSNLGLKSSVIGDEVVKRRLSDFGSERDELIMGDNKLISLNLNTLGNEEDEKISPIHSNKKEIKYIEDLSGKFSSSSNSSEDENEESKKRTKGQILNISVASIESPDRQLKSPTRKRNKNENVPETFTEGNKVSSEEDVYVTQGLVARKMGNYKLSLEQFTKAIAINPRCFKAFFNRAFTYNLMKNYSQAIADYTTANSINSKSPYAYYNRGIIYSKIEEFSKALEDFTVAIRLLPSRSEFFYNRACCYKKLKDYQKALKDFSKYISTHKSSYDAFFYRGICYEYLNMLREALADFETATMLSPKQIPPYYHIANIYSILNNNEKAIESLKTILNINPNKSLAYHNIGLLYTKCGMLDEAITYFNKSIEKGPNNSVYYHNRSCAYELIGDIDQAIEDLSSAIKLDGEKAIYYNGRAFLYFKEKKYAQAIEDYTSALKIEPNNTVAYINRGVVYVAMGEFEKGIQDYNSAIEISKEEPKGYYHRAIAYEKIKGCIDKAIEDYNTVIALEPMNANAYMRRGICYENKGDVEKSYQDYEKSLLIDKILTKQ